MTAPVPPDMPAGRDELSIVQRNLLEREGYSPYCGNMHCRYGMPRTHFLRGQFRCGCGWVSEFERDFISRFLARWPDRAQPSLDKGKTNG